MLRIYCRVCNTSIRNTEGGVWVRRCLYELGEFSVTRGSAISGGETKHLT